jgi:hypothetical protein
MRNSSALCVLLALAGCSKKEEPAAGSPAKGSAAAAEPPARMLDLPLDLPSDDTPNVLHLGNKLEGDARAQGDVYPWLDEHVVPWVKPCIARLPSGSTVHVAMQLGKDGRVADTKVSVKNAAGQADPPDQTVTDCLGQVGAKTTIATAAQDVATAGMRFVVQ